jgi:hypothetical protein
VEVYDIRGRRAGVVFDGMGVFGDNRLRWRTRGLPAGAYFMRVAGGGWTEARAFVLLE